MFESCRGHHGIFDEVTATYDSEMIRNLGNLKDLVNQRFGRLVALHPTNEKRGKYIIWECMCDCGKAARVSSNCLTNGNTRSCGCLRKDTVRKVDLTGQRFGRLVALRPTDERRQTYVVWECACDCGNTAYANSHGLQNGNNLSCGCLKEEYKTILFEKHRNSMFQDGTSVALLAQTKPSKRNTSGIVGVWWSKRKGKWIASITAQGKTYTLGFFDDIEDARIAREKGVEKYHLPLIKKYRK